MVMNAKPRDLPVIRSIISDTSLTVPCCSKRSWRSFSVVSKERLPTYSFIVICFGKNCQLQSRSRESSFKSPPRKTSPDDLPRNERYRCIPITEVSIVQDRFNTNDL